MSPCHPSLWLAVLISLLAGLMLALLLILALVAWLSYTQCSTLQIAAHLAIMVCWTMLFVPALNQLFAGSPTRTARPASVSIHPTRQLARVASLLARIAATARTLADDNSTTVCRSMLPPS